VRHRIAFHEVRLFLDGQYRDREVSFVCLDAENYTIYARRLDDELERPD
jgi:hypothetical protein